MNAQQIREKGVAIRAQAAEKKRPMTAAEIFTKNAAMDLAKIAENMAYTVPALDDYEPELNKAEHCLEEIRFYVRQQRKDEAERVTKAL